MQSTMNLKIIDTPGAALLMKISEAPLDVLAGAVQARLQTPPTVTQLQSLESHLKPIQNVLDRLLMGKVFIPDSGREIFGTSEYHSNARNYPIEDWHMAGSRKVRKDRFLPMTNSFDLSRRMDPLLYLVDSRTFEVERSNFAMNMDEPMRPSAVTRNFYKDFFAAVPGSDGLTYASAVYQPQSWDWKTNRVELDRFVYDIGNPIRDWMLHGAMEYLLAHPAVKDAVVFLKRDPQTAIPWERAKATLHYGKEFDKITLNDEEVGMIALVLDPSIAEHASQAANYGPLLDVLKELRDHYNTQGSGGLPSVVANGREWALDDILTNLGFPQQTTQIRSHEGHYADVGSSGPDAFGGKPTHWIKGYDETLITTHKPKDRINGAIAKLEGLLAEKNGEV